MRVYFETSSDIDVYGDGLSVMRGKNHWLGTSLVSYELDANYFDEVGQQTITVMKRFVGDATLQYVRDNAVIVSYQMIGGVATPIDDFKHVFDVPIAIDYKNIKYYFAEQIKEQLITWYDNIGIVVEQDEIFVSGVNSMQFNDYPNYLELLSGFPASINKLPSTTKIANDQLGLSGRQLIRRTYKEFALFGTKFTAISATADFIAIPNTANLSYYLFAFSSLEDYANSTAVWSMPLNQEIKYGDYDEDLNPIGPPIPTDTFSNIEYLDDNHVLKTTTRLAFAIGLYKTGNETNIRNAGRLRRACVELS